MKLEQFLESKYTKQTTSSYLYSIENFLSINLKAKEFTYQDIVDYFSELQQDYSAEYCSRVLSAVKTYFDFLIETNQRNDHPCKTLSIKTGRKNKIQLQDLFSSGELEELLQRENRYKFLDARNNVLISLLIYQGLASRELVKLRLKDIDTDKMTIKIRSSSKLNKRILLMHPKQVKFFYEYMEVRSNLTNNKQKIFIVNKLGSPLTVDGVCSVFDQFKSLFSGRKLSPSTIRQSVIMNWLNEKGKSIEEVQELSGHKFMSTTELYLRDTNETSKRLINQFYPLNK